VSLEVELLDGVARASPEEWNALVGAESPFLEWEWLASLEHAGCVGPETGWQPRPLVLRRDGRIAAACPLYVKAHSEGEFVFDWSWADAAERAGIRYYPKLLVGVPFTPVSGARFLTGGAAQRERAELIAHMGAALREICAHGALSGVHINFCREDECSALAGGDYLLRVSVQYHWHNADYASFDDYLNHLRSKRRNQVKRERRSVAEQGVAIEVRSGSAISDALFEPLFRCYLTTIESQHYGRQYLNRRFFELLRERFCERLCFTVARRGGEIVAGTINVVKGDTLYGRYWGALQPIRYLHFDACYYAAIQHCIETGLRRFEPGAGGDYKFLRGFDARPTFSLHHLADARLAEAVAHSLEWERARARLALDQLQRHSALKHPGT
jgi:predicted N-acyltransferase